AHAVIAGAEAAADDEGELGHADGRYGGHHLGAIACDAARFIFLADHEAGDVLQEQEWNAALPAQLDEVGRLQCGFVEQDPVVAENSDRIAPDMRKTTDDGGAIELLELVELAAIDDACDQLAHIVGNTRIRRNHPINFLGRIKWRAWLTQGHTRPLDAIEIGDDAARDAEGMAVVQSIVIGDTRHARMDIGTAQLLGGDYLANRRLHQ